MKLIVISSSVAASNEHEIINSCFDEGLEILHIHKPLYSKKEIKKFVQQIPSEYHKRIVLHSDFPKFHSLEELEACKEKYEYAFLSPIFDSISKKDYKTQFSQTKSELISELCGKPVIALGGIDEDKVQICRELGFAGVAVCGAIWQSTHPIEKFIRIKEKC